MPDVTLHGGGGDDFIATDGHNTVSAGPGNDTVLQTVACSTCDAPFIEEFTGGHPLDAGACNDLLRVDDSGADGSSTYNTIGFDMAAGTLHADSTSASVTGFENLWVTHPSTTRYSVTGTDDPNTMTWYDSQVPVVVRGLGGDDTMNGGSADDTLDGGTGDDTADGQGGTDTCASIEHATLCEVLN